MDSTIAELVRGGAPEALDLLLARFGDEIQGVAYLIVRDRLDAEDIMAETLITAWRKGPELRDPAALRLANGSVPTTGPGVFIRVVP